MIFLLNLDGVSKYIIDGLSFYPIYQFMAVIFTVSDNALAVMAVPYNIYQLLRRTVSD